MLNDSPATNAPLDDSSAEPDPHYRYARPIYRCFEREPGRLQLRVTMRPGEYGICEVMVAEDDETVEVLVIVCGRADRPISREVDSPTHVDLKQPLGDRIVRDGARDGNPVEIIDGDAFYAEIQEYANALWAERDGGVDEP